MDVRIKTIIDNVIAVEGGYVDNPNDPGGKTKYGITEAVARSYGYSGAMINLPKSTAFQIYYMLYVVAPNFDDVALVDSKVAEELIDSGVNVGPNKSSKWFQFALNCLNDRERDYKDISEDGNIGPATLRAFQSFKKRRGVNSTQIMLCALDSLQGYHYLTLAKDNSKFESFLNGWLMHRIRNVN